MLILWISCQVADFFVAFEANETLKDKGWLKLDTIDYSMYTPLFQTTLRSQPIKIKLIPRCLNWVLYAIIEKKKVRM